MRTNIPTLRSRRAGMTLIELLIALALFGVVISAALWTFARQNSAYQVGIDRMSAMRGARYAAAKLESDLRTMGTNVPGDQPEFVYGADDVVAFTADYATNLEGDPFAVYHEPGAPTGQVTLPRNPVPIPNSGASFPDTVISQFSVRSPAELIMFYFAPDETSEADDDYALYRQVNDGEPERVASGLKRVEGEPFFEYLRIGVDQNQSLSFRPVADSLMPMFNSAKTQGLAADTGRSAIPDSVRAVRIRMVGSNGQTGDRAREITVTRTVDLPNVGFGQQNTCGSRPILGSNVAAGVATLPSGEPVIRLGWNAAVDEEEGEQDVVRYAIYRRQAGFTDWGDPYRAIPSGQGAYTFEDDAAEPGIVYEYGVAAQDCTPALSTLSISNTVVLP